MKTNLPVPDSLVARIEWIEETFPSFELKAPHLPLLMVAEHNTPLNDSEGNDDDDSWIRVQPHELIELKPITHPHWLEDWDFEWPEVKKDAEAGVTFAIYWKEGKIAWER